MAIAGSRSGIVGQPDRDPLKVWILGEQPAIYEDEASYRDELRKELEPYRTNTSALKARARDIGLPQTKINSIDYGKDIAGALIELIVEAEVVGVHATARGDTREEEAMAKLKDSPDAMVQPWMEDKQRVLKVCLGAEHGILLTDAGIACTWGDNRYGQLGRRPCRKEEDEQPFPVLELQNEEISQIAAGRHHCLALTATGLVWSWGRNKCGQLGCGDHTRDRVLPEKVCILDESGYNEMQLGSGPNEKARIITIGAGNNSSVAASIGSDVWQWGEISEQFKIKGKEKDKKDSRGNRHGHDPQRDGRPVVRNRPHKIFEFGMYRSGLRDGRVSISELGCRVLGTSDDRNNIKDRVEALWQLQASINRERHEIAKFDTELQDKQERRQKNSGEGDGSEQRNLQETLAMLELEVDTCTREIDILKKNLKSCNMQQVHNRDQINALMHQGTRLNNAKDEQSGRVLEMDKGTAERKHREEKLTEIKEFVDANQNTRMTLLDQLAETDKEKQRIQSKLYTQEDYKKKLEVRYKTVKELGQSAGNSAGSSDSVMKFLKESKNKIKEHFETRTEGSDFVEAKRKAEEDRHFLEDIQAQMKEMVACSGPGKAQRATQVKDMIEDVIKLRQSWMDLQQDRWERENLNLSSFFKKPVKDDLDPMLTNGADRDQMYLPPSRV